jgi:hypothetical protein
MFNKTLDVTHLKQRGDKLVKKISEMVNDKTAFIIGDVPSELKISEDQYTSMIEADELEFMMDYSQFEDRLKPSADKLFHTGQYVLEVKVVEDGAWIKALNTKES